MILAFAQLAIVYNYCKIYEMLSEAAPRAIGQPVAAPVLRIGSTIPTRNILDELYAAALVVSIPSHAESLLALAGPRRRYAQVRLSLLRVPPLAALPRALLHAPAALARDL